METQLGSGTFIGSTEIKISTKERQEKLNNISREFLTIASSYGFTLNDLINELHKMDKNEK